MAYIVYIVARAFYFLLGVLICFMVSNLGYVLFNYHVLNYNKTREIDQTKYNLSQCIQKLRSVPHSEKFLACDGTVVSNSFQNDYYEKSRQLSFGISYRYSANKIIMFSQSKLGDLILLEPKQNKFFVYESDNFGYRPWNYFGRP